MAISILEKKFSIQTRNYVGGIMNNEKEWNLLEKKKRVGELRIKEYGHSDAGILSCCLFNGVLSLEDERLPEAHT